MSDLKWWQDKDRYILSPWVELTLYREELEKLERENAALRAEVNVTRKNYEEYKTENITLREELEFAIKAGARREADLLVMLGKEAQP